MEKTAYNPIPTTKEQWASLTLTDLYEVRKQLEARLKVVEAKTAARQA